MDDPVARFTRPDREAPSRMSEAASYFLAIVSALTGSATSPSATVAAITSIVLQIANARRDGRNAMAWKEGLNEAIKDLDTRILNIETKLSNDQAREAVMVAVEAAQRSVREDKAEMFGRIIGATLGQHTPNWSEATEFVRDVERFTDLDLKTLMLLWQRHRAFVTLQPDGRPTVLLDSNRFVSGWQEAVKAAADSGLSQEEFDSRCARLTGFGLAVVVSSTPAASYGPVVSVYRITGRAVRLLELLGRATVKRKSGPVPYGHVDDLVL
jgi:hypothetical protein